MKQVNIVYWIFTALLCALMALSAYGSFFMKTPESVAMMSHIGFGPHILPFLAVLKVLGIIALLVPNFPRLKEWAYAGFTFDLVGALYAFVAAGDGPVNWAGPLVGLVLVAVSYIYWHKKLNLQQRQV